MDKNPIFIEHYRHESSDCYKILNPWTGYRQEKLVLCKVDEGIELAKERAKKYLAEQLENALGLELEKDPCIDCGDNVNPCKQCPKRPEWKR